MKKLYTFCFFLLFLLGMQYSLHAQSNENLLFHYTFEEVNNETVSDLSGNNLDAVPTLATERISGYKGQALRMGPKEAHLNLPDNLHEDLSSFTFAFWVKLDELKGSTRFFDWGTGSDGDNNFIAFIPSYGGDNRMMALRFRPSSGSVSMAFSNKKCPVGVWSHIALSFNWDAETQKGTARFFINGQAAGEGQNLPYNPADFLPNSLDNYIGFSRYLSETNGFNGAVDDVRLYNLALPAEQIKDLAGLNGIEGDLLAQYDFSMSNEESVQDVGNFKLNGTLKNEARIVTVGNAETGFFNVLNLGNHQGYFDMGAPLGDLLVQATDYTVSAYYRVAESNNDLHQNGNFLWNFSNSADAMQDQNGYLIASLKDQSISITPGYYTSASGNQALAFSQPALKGNWHHLAYTQQETTGTLYIDGIPVKTGPITNTPFSALSKSGLTGTAHNWIGRSAYPSDAYLKQTLVYDVRLYRRALNQDQIKTSVLKVESTLAQLERASKAFIGNEKTEESTNRTPKANPKSDQLSIKGQTDASFPLAELEELVFEGSQMVVSLKGGNTQVFNTNNIQKLFFMPTSTRLPSTIHNKLSFYPNPARSEIRFSAFDEGQLPIEIYTLTGVRVLQTTMQQGQYTLDVNSLPAGIYLLKAGTQTFKLQKK